ncbi:hypothetical protein MMYC01_204089 [Madurella mycetomatis]|uniref:Uncharacterized protein n=1 Tax=Madurella mycetomatis TaxID=100816 RepID=A0A175W1Z1_9PEZI|nr:hypothetical protein MMYC01_204805 [Madurella mycetomatis]KXX81124.1 hypothetical protein MMYC01_204089 [Madurella mycetomatis]
MKAPITHTYPPKPPPPQLKASILPTDGYPEWAHLPSDIRRLHCPQEACSPSVPGWGEWQRQSSHLQPQRHVGAVKAQARGGRQGNKRIEVWGRVQMVKEKKNKNTRKGLERRNQARWGRGYSYCLLPAEGKKKGSRNGKERWLGLPKEVLGVVGGELGHNGGKYYVLRGAGVRALRKEPRPTRGSGSVQALDDPVKDGRELAGTRDFLPSDRWRGAEMDRRALGTEVTKRVSKRRLRYEEGEREDGFTLSDISHEEPVYTVRVVAQRCGEEEQDEIGKMGDDAKATSPSLDGSTPGPVTDESGAESDSGCECDFLIDVDQVEAAGWVPVMVPEDEGGDDWMSLKGSWVLMRGPRETTVRRRFGARKLYGPNAA